MPSGRSCPGICYDLVGSFLCPSKIPQFCKFDCVANTCRYYTLLGVLVAIISLFLTTGLMMGPARHYPRRVTPIANQMYIQDWFSNVWCDRVNVTTTSIYPLSLNAYLLDKADKGVCNPTVQTIKGPLSAMIQGGDILTINLTLNQGDRISAKICMSDLGKLYMFTRRMDFLRCIKSDSRSRCGLRGPYRWEIEAACKNYDKFDNPYLLPPQSITNDGEYFFVLYNRGSIPAPASIMFTKPIPNTYLLDRALVSCQDKWICTFNLGGMSEPPKTVCFEVIRSSSLPDSDDNDYVEITCGVRVWLYMVGLFVLFLCIGIVGTIFIFTCCYKKTNRRDEPGPQRYDADYSRAINPSNSNRNTDIASSRDTASRNVGVNRHRFDNVPVFHDSYHDTDQDSVSRNGSGSLNFEPELSTPDRHSTFSDAPPSYDEVMKGATAEKRL